MGDKKHIDRLFQERFKDFEVAPDDAVWDKIEAKLKQKKKRRVIPLWWRYAGIAAIVLLLLTIGGIAYFGNEKEAPAPEVVDIEKSDVQDALKESPATDLNNASATEQVVVSNEKETLSTEDQEKNSSEKQSNKEKLEKSLQVNQPETVIANSSSNDKSVENDINTPQLNNNTAITNKLISQDKNKALVENLNTNAPEENRVKTEVSEQTNPTGKKPLFNEKNNAIAVDNSENTKNEVGLLKDDADVKTKNITDIAVNEPSESTKTIEEAIAENKSLLEEDTQEKLNKWSVAPNVAPVYFSSLGKGSSIDPQFNNNSKSGEVNMSYGINASYAINNKLTIRSGINRVNLGYNTNDVVVFNSLSASSSSSSSSAIRTVETTAMVEPAAIDTPDNITIVSAQSFDASNSPATLDTSNTTINQSLGYIEIPLELQYAISTKRFGLNVIGGFSSLFLSNNDLFSEIDGTRTRLGEATNINKTSYSANFGLGVNYKISEKINLNLEPMFKYQINTFRNTSGDFQPFFIGVYTGFGIKF